MRSVLHHLFSPNSFPIMMRFNIMFSCLVISVLCFLLLCCSSWAVEGQCLDEQRHLLLHLKHNLSFSSSEFGVPVGLSSWDLNTDCCRSWEGVECNQIGEVIGLDLSYQSILGSTDGLASLFHLSHLQRLNLGFNNFNSTIPSGFDRLPHLTHLDLSNSFLGQIPIGISRLMRLVSLDLSVYFLFARENDLLKLENPNLRMLVGNLSELRELRLDGVNISSDKERNEWAQIFSSSLPKLQVLSLFNCSLSGPFHSSLSKLHSLTELQLSLNNFSAEIPECFRSFSNLTVLNLRNCGLKGNVPQSIFTLPKLQYLDLSYNPLLEGSLPEFPQDNSLQYLSTLDLSRCNFNGSIPASLFALPSLKRLHLSHNQFSGHLDESTFESPPQLEVLGLSSNKLEGPIPLSIFNITSLVFFYLDSNQFNGTLELNRFEALTNLSVLDLSENLLSIDANNINSALFPKVSTFKLRSCNLRVFPDFLQNQSKLTYLDLSSNNIGGNLPSWINNIGNGLVLRLNLSSNSLENPIQPFSNNSFRVLQLLDLHSNLFSAPLPILPPSAFYLDYSKNNCSFMPSNIGSFLSNARFFSLASNNVHGQLPESLCRLGALQVLDLSNNSLSGSILSCIERIGGGLKVLNLQRNRLFGTMNASLPKDCALRTFDLNGNRLEGQLSSSLGYCTMLEVIDLGNNQFTGTFPHWLGNLATLRVLVLRSNHFHGPIGVPQPGYRFPKLQVVDISSNRFSGTLPFEWIKSWDFIRNDKDETGSKAKLQILRFGSFSYYYQDEVISYYYQDEVTVTSKGLEIEYVEILTILTLVDLSNNAFEGAIPKEIGDLKALCILNLSHNALTGPIPSSIGNLEQLESFDLSQNQLSGMIPSELTGLTFLSVMNLSYNNLVGKIPSGPQFDRFEEISYKGNNGLCGPPLSKKCTVVRQHTTGNRVDDDHKDELCEALKFLFNDCTDNKSEFKWQLIVTALGFGIGNGIACWLVLVFYGSRSKRNSRRHRRNQHRRNRL